MKLEKFTNRKLIVLLSICLSTHLQAQVKIGNNPGSIDPNALLQLENATSGPAKGVIFPSMSNSQRDSLTSPSKGMWIFNVTSNCFEFYDGTLWQNMCGQPNGGGSSIGTLAGSPNGCAPIAVNGTYKTGVPLDATNTIQVQVIITGVGNYNIVTPVINGIHYAGSGVFATTGIRSVTLQGIGTPITTGLFSFPVFYGTSTCYFDLSITNGSTTTSGVSCTGTLNGTYSAGAPLNGATNNKDVSVTFTTAGNYVISTNTINGVAFSATGAAAGPGTQTVNLKASGTGINGGNFTYTVTAPGQTTCTFNVPFASPANPLCASKVYSSPFPAPLTNGQSYTGTIVVPYQSGNGTGYAAESMTVNGITLSRSAGTYAVGNGTITYNYSGTFTGTSNAYITFSPTIGNTVCEVGMGDAIRAALSVSGPAYDANSVQQWVQVTQAEYNNVVATVFGTSRKLQTETNMLLTNASGSLGYGATFCEDTLPGTRWTSIPPSNYIIGLSLVNLNGGGGSTYSTSGLEIKLSQGIFSPFVRYANPLPQVTAGAVLPQTRYYFVLKRPSTTSAAGAPSLTAFYVPYLLIGAVPAGGPFNVYQNVGNSSNLGGPPLQFSETTQLQVLATPFRAW